MLRAQVVMRRPLLSCTLLLAASCSDNGSDTAAIVYQPDVAITTANARAVTQAAVRSLFDLQRICFLPTFFLRIPPPDPPASGPPPGEITRVFPGATGFAVYTWQDRDGDYLYSTGDVFSISLSDYTWEDFVLSGTVVFDRVDVSGNVVFGFTWLVTGRLDIISMAVSIGSQLFTINASMPFKLEKREIVDLFEIQLVDDVDYGPYQLRSGTVLGRNDYTNISSGLPKAQYGQGYVTDSGIGGTIGFATRGLMTGTSFAIDPQVGKFDVFGASSSIEAEALFNDVRVRIDTNGDGQFDATQFYEWPDFLPF